MDSGLEPNATTFGAERNSPNERLQASIAISLKRIADILEEMLIIQQAKQDQDR